MKASITVTAEAILKDLPKGERIALAWKSGKVIEHARGANMEGLKKRHEQAEIVHCWIDKRGTVCIAPQGTFHSPSIVIK